MTPEQLEKWANELDSGRFPSNHTTLYDFLRAIAAKMREPDGYDLYGVVRKLAVKKNPDARPFVYINDIDGGTDG